MSYRMVYYYGTVEGDQDTCEFKTRTSEDGLVWGAEATLLKESPTYNTLGPNLTTLSDGRVLLTYNRLTRDPTVKLGIFFRLSSDKGASFGDAANVPTSYIEEAEGGPIIELSDGRWCCPFWAESPVPGADFDSACIFSSADGETWEDESIIANSSVDGRSYVEPNIIEYEAGKLLALFRIPPDGSADQNQAWQSRSEDGGITWSAPAFVFDCRGAPRMCLLSNGKIVAYIRGDPLEYPTIHTTADYGVNWSALQVLLYQGKAHYGDIVELPGDKVGIAYGLLFDGVAEGAIFYTVKTFAELP